VGSTWPNTSYYNNIVVSDYLRVRSDGILFNRRRGGSDAIAHASPNMTGTTTKNNDGDGMPNSNDSRDNYSNLRCFEEGTKC